MGWKVDSLLLDRTELNGDAAESIVSITEPGGNGSCGLVERLEMKFVAHITELCRFVHWLKLNPAAFRSQHSERIVNNIYFDTMQLGACAEHLAGVASHSKVRYRWYGLSRFPTAGTLEIKCKRNQLGWKVRYPVDEAPYVPGADWRQIRTALMQQLPADGRYWLQVASMPVLINRYSRKYFISFDGAVRATIDTENLVWDQRLKSSPDFEANGKASSWMILEFKFEPAHRQVVCDMMSGIPCRVSRCSKYMSGAGVMA